MEMNQYPASIFIQILTEMTFLIYYKYKRAKGHPLKFTIRFEASQKSFQPVCLIFTRQRLWHRIRALCCWMWSRVIESVRKIFFIICCSVIDREYSLIECNGNKKKCFLANNRSFIRSFNSDSTITSIYIKEQCTTWRALKVRNPWRIFANMTTLYLRKRWE